MNGSWQEHGMPKGTEAPDGQIECAQKNCERQVEWCVPKVYPGLARVDHVCITQSVVLRPMFYVQATYP